MRGRACTIGAYFLPLNHSPGSQSGGEVGEVRKVLRRWVGVDVHIFQIFIKKVECWGPFELPLIWYWAKNRVGNQVLVHYAIAKMTKAMDKARGYKNSWHTCHIEYICHVFKPFKSSIYWGWEGVLLGGHSNYKQSKMKFHMRIF